MNGDIIFELSFASFLSDGVGLGERLAMARRSWRDTHRSGLTGFLRFDDRKIDQTLEGPGDVVLQMAARILSDPRHGRIVVRVFGPTSARRFSDWKVEGLDAPPPALGSGEFRPQVVAGRGGADRIEPRAPAARPQLTRVPGALTFESPTGL